MQLQMRTWRAAVAVLALCLLASAAPAAEPGKQVDVRLTDGTVVKGEVTATSASDVTLRTDYGVLRLPAEKLSPESRRALLQPRDAAACEAQVRELEAKVRELEVENQELRKRLVSAPAAAPLMSSPSSASARPGAGLTYTISSTGKRHNSTCRYYAVGRPCGPHDGVACKVCGG